MLLPTRFAAGSSAARAISGLTGGTGATALSFDVASTAAPDRAGPIGRILVEVTSAQVVAAYRDKPILSAQQVEDVVAYLATLREPAK